MFTKNQVNFLIIADLALLIAALCFVNYSSFDLRLQNHLFNFETKNWLIDADEPVKKFIFYTLPKILLGVGIFAALVATIFGFKNKAKKSQFFFKNRHKFLLIFLGLALIPLTVGNIKKITDIYCPNQLAEYSGQYPHTRIFAKYDENFLELRRNKSPHGEAQQGKANKGQCFPAGHPVTAFCLMILFFALEKKSHKFIGLFAAIVLGWVLGFYQMAKGAHFFGHNLVSMFACFLVAALIFRIAQGLHPKGFVKSLKN